MHTKKINNTNKLMQISYHSALTKIQKLQNLKKKIKTFFLYWSVSPVPAGTWPVFFPVRNRGLYDPVCLPVRYIPAIPAGMVRN